MEIATALLEVTGDAVEPTAALAFSLFFFLDAQRPRPIFFSALF